MKFAKTKIVCTIGPASMSKETLLELARDGMDVARLNFSHGDYQTHSQVIKNIREIEQENGLTIGIMQDIQGPKIRTGEVENGAVELKDNSEFIITTDDIGIGNSQIVSTRYKDLPKEVKPNNIILIDDGYIILQAKKVDNRNIYTNVIKGGILKDHKGIIVPKSKSLAPTLNEKDLNDLKFGLEAGVDFISLSFVRSHNDLVEIRTAMKIFGRSVPVIAKIERSEAFDDIDEIISNSDGIMVARGDLGLEMPLEDIPILQKELIHNANKYGKPVITATQMLESMINNPMPTRAEVTDVANAVLDGTDAVMLSGETSIGRYPIEAVKFMNSIILKTENAFPKKIEHNFKFCVKENISDAIAQSAVVLAYNTEAKVIITITRSAYTARNISKFRPNMPIIAITDDIAKQHYLITLWGVNPIVITNFDFNEIDFSQIQNILKNKNIIEAGDKVVVVAGLNDNNIEENNFIKVIQI